MSVEVPQAAATDITSAEVIGVDLGTSDLIVAAANSADLYADHALELSADIEYSLIRQFSQMDTTDSEVERLMDIFEELLYIKIDKSVDTLIRYARAHQADKIAVEEFSYPDPVPLIEHAQSGRQVSHWLLPATQQQIVDRCSEAGFEVEKINHYKTSQQCGWCGEMGTRARSGVFHCNNGNCGITGADGDRNAAVNIARRASGDIEKPELP